MKHILLLGTGGTIASEMGASGLDPRLDTHQLLSYVPALSQLCRLDCRQLLHLDSTNMTPAHWLQIARAVEDAYEEYDGFVIVHGTDTMAYTAAALSYLIQNSPKPIVLTGAQRPIGFETTDSKQNLSDAVRYACHGSGGVQIVFNGKVILGTRAKKTHSKSFQAFSSINYPLLAVIQDDKLIQYIRLEPQTPARPVFYRALGGGVGLLKLIPGMDCEVLDFMLARHDALIVESFGVGGLPRTAENDYSQSIRRWVDAGKFVVMSTQVQNEGSDLAVYHVGRWLKEDARILEAFDMTTEAVVAKIMWILAQTRQRTQVERLFYTPVAHDILGGA